MGLNPHKLLIRTVIDLFQTHLREVMTGLPSSSPPSTSFVDRTIEACLFRLPLSEVPLGLGGKPHLLHARPAAIQTSIKRE